MESGFFESRIRDSVEFCINNSVPKFVGFLTSEESAAAVNIVKSRAKWQLFGGYENAERCMLGIFPEYMECNSEIFPISAFTVTYKKEYKLSHRDFLGAIMSLGIKRETVGDILVEDGRAVIFCKDEILKFITSGLEKVGNVGVRIENSFTLPLPKQSEKITVTYTVASARLDATVGALIGTSRSKSSDIISEGLVSVNSVMCKKITQQVNGGDYVTVRGYGKYKIISVNDKTKKGRTVLISEKYR